MTSIRGIFGFVFGAILFVFMSAMVIAPVPIKLRNMFA